MTLSDYWEMIGDGPSAWNKRKLVISNELQKLGDESKRDYIDISDSLMNRLACRDVYIAYFLLADGFVGEDGWLDFRYSIIILGESGFNEIVHDPDKMIDYSSLKNFEEISIYDIESLDGICASDSYEIGELDREIRSEDIPLIKKVLPRLYLKSGQTAFE